MTPDSGWKWRTWPWVQASILLMVGCSTFPANSKDSRQKPKFDSSEFSDIATNGYQFRVSNTSWRSLQHQNVVMQKYDYSCGSAALATLLRYYFQDDVDEQRVLQQIFVRLAASPDPKAEVKDRIQNGFSMLDLFNVAKDLGYHAAVVKIPLGKLAQLPAPTLVRIEKHEYKHFVVFRGVHEETVYLADPTRGNVRLAVHEFVKQWSGEVLVLGKAGFGLPKEHPLALHVDGPARPELDVARLALFPAP